jgi:molybdopterin-guanine dinucleotide biosynthesis protein A
VNGVTLAVIAGGAGSRMGGPKHRLVVNGKPILERLMERMAWEGPTMLVIGASGDIPAHGFEKVIRDDDPGQGPLAGIRAALRGCETEWMAAVPVDMPGLAGVHVRWVIEQCQKIPCSCAMIRRGRVEGAIEPFPVVVKRSAAEQIERIWDGRQRAVRDLVTVDGAAVLDAPESWGLDVWINLNAPEDLAEYGRAGDTMGTRSRGREGGGT